MLNEWLNEILFLPIETFKMLQFYCVIKAEISKETNLTLGCINLNVIVEFILIAYFNAIKRKNKFITFLKIFKFVEDNV